MIRILLADDEAMIRSALAALLELEPDITVVATADTGTKAATLAEQTAPDVCVLDLEMPGLDGVETAKAIRRTVPTKVLIVTRHARPRVLRRALSAKVQGFVPKSTAATDLAAVIRKVAAGVRWIDPELAALALTGVVSPLTDRELDVLRVGRHAASVQEIADRLHLAPGTVRNYLSNAMTKLGVRTRQEAADRAWDEGWI